jgi:hypothetical protein
VLDLVSDEMVGHWMSRPWLSKNLIDKAPAPFLLLFFSPVVPCHVGHVLQVSPPRRDSGETEIPS